MELRYAHLCDFVTQGQNRKLIFVGVFDVVYRRSAEGPVPLPACWLLAALDADFAEGSEHSVELRVVNEDGQEVMARTPLSSLVPEGLADGRMDDREESTRRTAPSLDDHPGTRSG